jgi:MFS family permease
LFVCSSHHPSSQQLDHSLLSFPAWLLFFRAVVGIGIGGLHVVYTLFSEFLPSKTRPYNLLVLVCFWSLGSLLAAGLAWSILPSRIELLLCLLCFVILVKIAVVVCYLIIQFRLSSSRFFFALCCVMLALGWKWFVFISAMPFVLVLCLYPWVPESPRFLLVSNQYDRVGFRVVSCRVVV